MEGFPRAEKQQKTTLERFEELYSSELKEVAYEDLPAAVRDHFESQSQNFIHPEKYQELNFDKLYSFVHGNGDVTYVAQQDKIYDDKGTKERLTYFADTREEQITGYLEMRLGLNTTEEYFKDKPFVGFTRTMPDFIHQGLGIVRLKEANAYSIAEYGYPLNSDTLMTEHAKRAWKELVLSGDAELYKEGEYERFRFVPTAPVS